MTIGEEIEGITDYQSALEAGLSIGSGEIEGGHRHVIQQRLNIPGAWRQPHNAEKELACSIRSNLLRAGVDIELLTYLTFLA